MQKRILLASGLIFVIFCIGYAVSRENRRTTGITNRESVYKGRIVMACSPDWSLLDTDSLGKSMVPLPGTGLHHWDIQTASDSAQFYFDQGIRLYYGFHIIESMASFVKAQSFDPENPMIHWARALAFGPNINDIEYQATPDALAEARKAKAGIDRVDSVGNSLINAMLVRYSADSSISRTKLNEAYAAEMKKVYDRYGNKPDVATLYADALMLLHPWKYWKKNGQPETWTPEIVQVLEKTLAVNPDHPGANHYYIHMVEASKEPGKALASADRLPSLMPGVSHMVHMPSHIYIRTGYYQKGINVNTQAVQAYQTYLNLYPDVVQNSPLYEMHNLHMKAACALMLSSYEFSASTAQELAMSIDTSYLSLPAPLGNFVQYLYMTPLMADVKFGKWDELLKSTVPAKKHTFAYALYLWGKGMAQVSKEFSNSEAKKTVTLLREYMKKPPMQVVMYPFNKPVEQITVGERILTGLIADKDNLNRQAEEAFKQAVAAEDKLIYNEPSDWLLPARYWLAMHYFTEKDLTAAEKVLQEDLRINPRNYQSMNLLSEIYTMTNRFSEAEDLNMQIKESAY